MAKTPVCTILAALLVLVAGCNSDCEKLYNKLTECESSDIPPKDEFVEECEASKDTERYKDLLDCIGAGGCVEFKNCMREKFEARWEEEEAELLREDIAKVQRAIDAKQLEEVPPCFRAEGPDANPELVAVCHAHTKQSLDLLRAEIQRLRDDRTTDRALSTKCGKLSLFAEKLGDEEKVAAEELCAEALLVVDILEALAKARKHIEEKKAEVPFECTANLENIEKVDSDWAKAARDEIVHTCFVELGLLVLQTKVPAELEWGCDFEVQKVYDAVKKYEISNPEMEPLILQAAERCEGK